MKPLNFLCFLGICMFLSTCSISGPTYFGASYPPTDTVQFFYDTKDIGRPYKVIGRMVAPTSGSERGNEITKLRLIARAKKAGANAIVFSDIIWQTHEGTLPDDLFIKAEAILFTEK